MINQLLIAPDRVLAVDFKSNRVVPEGPDSVPEGLMRQMAAYAHLLGGLFPERRVETAILWTATGRLMPLDAGCLGAALGRAALDPALGAS